MVPRSATRTTRKRPTRRSLSLEFRHAHRRHTALRAVEGGRTTTHPDCNFAGIPLQAWVLRDPFRARAPLNSRRPCVSLDPSLRRPPPSSAARLSRRSLRALLRAGCLPRWPRDGHWRAITQGYASPSGVMQSFPDQQWPHRRVAWEPYWLEQRNKHIPEIHEKLTEWLMLQTSLDRPFVASREIPKHYFDCSRYVRECLFDGQSFAFHLASWGRPIGRPRDCSLILKRSRPLFPDHPGQASELAVQRAQHH
jgi:hypothetical protein